MNPPAVNLVIEKGIEVPPQRIGRRPGPLSHVIRRMEVGDSVFVPKGVSTSVAFRIASLHGSKFTQRHCEEAGVSGVRVWRIA